MTARSELAGLITTGAPSTWEVVDHPVKGAALTSLQDAATPVAIVIEQRSIAAGQFSPDGQVIPVAIGLAVWVVVDGSRGDTVAVVEDLLEQAVETMIRILSPLPDHVWDGTAERGTYNDQQPAYSFNLSVAGAITESE